MEHKGKHTAFNGAPRIAVVGAGSMGTLLGARLTEQGVPVQMVDASPAIVAAINADGMTVTGTLSLHVSGSACLPEELEGQYDLVILLTKQTYNQAVYAELTDHLAPDGVLVTLQNGLPEQEAAAAFGAERVMGCAVTWAASLLQPGVTNATTYPAGWHNSLGRFNGAVDEKVLRVQGLLSQMCATEVTDRLAGIRWSKLLINSSFSGMSAALGATFGEILENPTALLCAQYIARECIQTARAAGVRMAPLAPGEDLERLVYFDDLPQRDAAGQVLRGLFSASPNGIGSMLLDLRRHIPCEVDYINGAVCRTARSVGVATPFCDAAVRVIRESQDGKRTPCMDNLALFPPVDV